MNSPIVPPKIQKTIKRKQPYFSIGVTLRLLGLVMVLSLIGIYAFKDSVGPLYSTVFTIVALTGTALIILGRMLMYKNGQTINDPPGVIR